MVNFLESTLFANLCNLFSAVGTVGAVIVSLYLIFRENNIKFRISGDSISLVAPFTSKSITGYGVTITNLSYNKNILLKQSPKILVDKKNCLLLIPNLKLPKEFIAPNILGPGEEYTFFIEEKQIRAVIEKTSRKKVLFIFSDKSNKKYKLKILKKDFEDLLNRIHNDYEKNENTLENLYS